jgi:hypothetical protein
MLGLNLNYTKNIIQKHQSWTLEFEMIRQYPTASALYGSRYELTMKISEIIKNKKKTVFWDVVPCNLIEID